MIVSRIIANIILTLSIILMPWWFSLILALIFSFLFFNFIEIILAGLLIDVLYGIPEVGYIGLPLLGLILSSFFYFMIVILKRKLKFYS